MWWSELGQGVQLKPECVLGPLPSLATHAHVCTHVYNTHTHVRTQSPRGVGLPADGRGISR